MVQPLRAYTILTEDQFDSQHQIMWLETVFNSSSMGSVALTFAGTCTHVYILPVKHTYT